MDKLMADEKFRKKANEEYQRLRLIEKKFLRKKGVTIHQK